MSCSAASTDVALVVGVEHGRGATWTGVAFEVVSAVDFVLQGFGAPEEEEEESCEDDDGYTSYDNAGDSCWREASISRWLEKRALC